VPHRSNLAAVLYFVRHGFSDAGVNLRVQNQNIVREPFCLSGPAGFEWLDRRCSGKQRIVPYFMNARNACQTLAADAGGSKKTKWRPAFGAQISQAESFDEVSLRSLEWLRRTFLWDVTVGRLW
jgi:hypothetical protein